MFQIKYKLCKRATLTDNRFVYYLTIFNKEEVIKELNLYPVLNLYVVTNSYTLYIDLLVDKNKVSAHKKTNIDLYKDLTFTEVLHMLNEFYNIDSTTVQTFEKLNIVQIMQLIIANWEDWH